MEKFEKLMKREGLGKLIEGAREVYIARFVDPYGDPIVIEEFDTKKEYDEWYENVGKGIEEAEGAKIKMDFGPSELDV